MGVGQLSHDGHDIPLRVQPCDQLPDFRLATMTRGIQDANMILRGEMACQQADGRERQRSFAQHVQDDRKLPRRARGFNPPVCRMLGEMQHLRAIGEERRAPLDPDRAAWHRAPLATRSAAPSRRSSPASLRTTASRASSDKLIQRQMYVHTTSHSAGRSAGEFQLGLDRVESPHSNVDGIRCQRINTSAWTHKVLAVL